MNLQTRQKISDLLERLETLEAGASAHSDGPIAAVAREAIVDELSRLTRRDWLAVYRTGDTIDAINFTH